MRSLLLPIALVTLAGCSGGGGEGGADHPPTFPTTVTIKYNGAAVEGATVTLSPTAAQGGTAAYGKTDSSGNATINAFDDVEGAVAGDYKVMVVKMETPAASTAVSEDDPNYDGAPEEEPEPPKSLIPEKYNSASTTDLEAKVTEGGENTFTFELTD